MTIHSAMVPISAARGRGLATILCIATLVLSGCTAVDKDWKAAQQINTEASYSDFLAKHPSGAHADEARSAIRALYTPTYTVLENCIREAICWGDPTFPGPRPEDGWTT
jgi:hypothetical protein